MTGPLAFLGALAIVACVALGVYWFIQNVEIKRQPKRRR